MVTPVYALQPYPKSVRRSIFLAGPTPRAGNVSSWRPKALEILEIRGFEGHVFVPEQLGERWHENYDAQIEWEDEGLSRADCILFWVPRDLATLPAFTTNHEHGEWFHSGRTVLGYPEGAPKMTYLYAKACDVKAPLACTLEDAVDAAITIVGQGANRHDAECLVPLNIWRNVTFQEWYGRLQRVGASLERFYPEWVGVERAGAKRVVRHWVAKVCVRRRDGRAITKHVSSFQFPAR